MKTTFSRQLATTALILLLALLMLGGSFRILVKGYLEKNAITQLTSHAEAISELAAAYDAAGQLHEEGLRTNLTLSSRISGADTVICNSGGAVVLCSDRNLQCDHLGMVVDGDYLDLVFASGLAVDSGVIRGLYEEARYVVSVPVVSQNTGANIGIVIVSMPLAATLSVMEGVADIQVTVSLLVILVAVVVTLLNVTRLPGIIARIFTDAFDLNAVFGGFSGSCVMYGIKRGLFSNEAGVGSAPNASASAEVSHPAKQGLVQVLSVFIDTILVCSATAFLCLSSGIEPTAELSGAPYVQASVAKTLGAFGPIFITVSMILFAFTTLLGNLFYVDKGLCFIAGRQPGKVFMRVYYVIASAVILFGAVLDADMLWNIADITMGGMTLINMPVILILSKYAIQCLKDYTAQRRKGLEPRFHAKDIGLPHEVDYWQ